MTKSSVAPNRTKRRPKSKNCSVHIQDHLAPALRARLHGGRRAGRHARTTNFVASGMPAGLAGSLLPFAYLIAFPRTFVGKDAEAVSDSSSSARRPRPPGNRGAGGSGLRLKSTRTMLLSRAIT